MSELLTVVALDSLLIFHFSLPFEEPLMQFEGGVVIRCIPSVGVSVLRSVKVCVHLPFFFSFIHLSDPSPVC